MEQKKNSNKSIEMESDPKTKNQINDPNADSDSDFYPDISNTVSASECTGMMYAPPQNEAEHDSYQELFNMQIPNKKEDN